MPTATFDMDLWPVAVRVPEQNRSPLVLLREQGRRLEEHTKGLLRSDIARVETSDRIGYRFEVIASRLDYRCTLFEVIHRKDFVYPCIILPPEPLPEYLRPRRYESGPMEEVRNALAASQNVMQMLNQKGKWVDNEWLCPTQAEFIEKLRNVLGSPEVVSTISSLIARSLESNGHHDPESTGKTTPTDIPTETPNV